MILRLPGPFYRGKDTCVLVNFHREKAEQTIWNRLEQRMQRGYTREAYLDLWPIFGRKSQKSHTFHRLQDDVSAEVKRRRLEELISVFREEASRVNASLIGSTQLLLVEGESKRSAQELCGQNYGNLKVIFPATQAFPIRSGDYVLVKITSASSQSLRGHALGPASLKSPSKSPWKSPSSRLLR
ncbi:mitochondrial tRNA methylthiotransferase CDK5RAP1-like isoform X2 [Anguilla anguilla]|uniref:mitochondrial tRNA methylthiotransferase CDK5RAP1-like isoform X2 n=1 Tax=Anguilla anguilla TaxID=7936 RepID=UPI0015A7B72C|nr:mitochondrial tRNA methylthiotransferase CDK5RAP1-like isoform X2 [Anguilla anguilla]